MKKISILLVLLVLLAFAVQSAFAQQGTSGKELDWKLGSQAYTFKNFTFAETLDKIASINLKYVEAYPGQQIGGGIEGKTHFTMNADTRKKVKDLLNSKGIKVVAYGVVTGKNEEEWRKIFEFANEMGIGVINSEPKLEDLDMVNKLAQEYGVIVALHNHPKPSVYWHPDTVLEAVKGRKNIKACADIGHWVRSGMDPVENLKKLEGHVVSMHFKDLNQKSMDAHDVPWGTGISNIAGVVKELKRQNFEGVISVEYEHNWDNSLPEVEQSVIFFRKLLNGK
jgi:sugar phosphate isomerase/epimerase